MKRNLTAYKERIEQLEETDKGQGHQQYHHKDRNQGQKLKCLRRQQI